MKKKKVLGLPVIFVAVLGVLIVLAVIFGVEAASQGTKLVVLEAKEQDLISQNQELKDNLALYSSYSEVSKQAERLGMVRQEKFVYLTSGGVALR